jgi:3-dehydroquinate synthase
MDFYADTVSRFACAAYRRNTNFIRIPTTVIGLIDASVSIKVAVNYGNYKNRLGAYHAPMHTFLDFDFLKTLPEAQVRNGFAELIKISSCADLWTFKLLDGFCEQLIRTHFGRVNNATAEVKRAADQINRVAIFEMLKLEAPNLHEIRLDRIIAYGHTWSPLHEVSSSLCWKLCSDSPAFANDSSTARPRHLNRHGVLCHFSQHTS